MPEITREEAKQYLRSMAESWERRVEWQHDRAARGDRHAATVAAAVGETAAIYRLALAALEDAERVDWLEARYGWSIGRSPEGALPGVSLYLPPKPSCPIDAATVRAAIDRARGVTDGQ